MTTDPFLDLKSWLEATHASSRDIPLDLDLIENRIIDSLELMEFIFSIEHFSGSEIELESLTVNVFRTLRSIRESFFAAHEGEVHG